MSAWNRRLRSVLDRRFVLFVLLLLALTLAGGWLSYQAYGTTETAVEQRPGPTATFVGEFDHGADVAVDGPVFAEGERLANRSTYFTRTTPVLDGRFRYTYSATGDGNLSVTATVDTVFRSVDDSGGDTGEYWRVRREVNRTSAVLAPTEELDVRFSGNVTELIDEIRRYDESVGRTPGSLEIAFVTTVTAEGTVNGEPTARSQTYRLGVDPDGSVYRVADPGPVTNETSGPPREVRVEVSPGPLERFGGPAAAVLGLLGLLSLGHLRYRGRLALDDRERATLTFERDRSEYDEWITTGRLPRETREKPTVEVDSLEGLVDVAIDSDRRVIEHESRREFVTVVDDVVYRFAPPRDPDDESDQEPIPTTDDPDESDRQSHDSSSQPITWTDREDEDARSTDSPNRD
ncbi:DUF5305 domain-containing protein [Halorientalis halophila]|uniref:DUF5305 domain-containing protein n=1 Tax=Halorientalis halophila TaxID=3108499 RepID=UPI00300A2488